MAVSLLDYVNSSLLNEAVPIGDKAKAKDQERLSRACLLEEDIVSKIIECEFLSSLLTN